MSKIFFLQTYKILPKCPTSTPLTALVGRIGVLHTLILGGMSHSEGRHKAHRADARGTLWRVGRGRLGRWAVEGHEEDGGKAEGYADDHARGDGLQEQ